MGATYEPQFAKALGKLRQSETQQLAGSALTKPQREALEHFARQTGSVQIQPGGRGVVYKIVQSAIIERHWRDLTPIEPTALASDLPNRASNIAMSRSSKSARHGHAVCYLLLKAGPGPVSWQNDAGHRLDLRQATDQLGAAALAVHRHNNWTTGGALWLVENQALFDRLDWLPGGANTSITYYSGQLSNGLLEWLAERPRAAPLWFFPDYDSVGLQNYARLKARLGATVRLWLMPDWETRLIRYGNRDLWPTTARDLPILQEQQATLALEPEVLRLLQAMQRHGRVLEQEAIWLPV
ncbi:MAG: hypothetical protein R3F53_19395 [Gammaproteobacteria bacterium]